MDVPYKTSSHNADLARPRQGKLSVFRHVPELWSLLSVGTWLRLHTRSDVFYTNQQ